MVFLGVGGQGVCSLSVMTRAMQKSVRFLRRGVTNERDISDVESPRTFLKDWRPIEDVCSFITFDHVTVGLTTESTNRKARKCPSVRPKTSINRVFRLVRGMRPNPINAPPSSHSVISHFSVKDVRPSTTKKKSSRRDRRPWT